MRTFLVMLTATAALALATSAQANSILSAGAIGGCSPMSISNDGTQVGITFSQFAASSGDAVSKKEKKEKCAIEINVACDAEGAGTATTEGTFAISANGNGALDITVPGGGKTHNTFGPGAGSFSIQTPNVKVCPKGKDKDVKVKFLLQVLKVPGGNSELSVDTISFTLN